ncbi:hypothetical protein ACETU7_26570 [Rhodococcus sp. 3Y1]
MGSADVMAWLAEGYLAGDPIRYPLYVGSMFLAMPFQLIGVILGHPSESSHQARAVDVELPGLRSPRPPAR